MKSGMTIWSVAVGARYAAMFGACVASARACGVVGEFHVFGDHAVSGAEWHKAEMKAGPLMGKIEMLERLEELPGTWFVFLDADTWFVRRPQDLVGPARASGLHVPVECNLSEATVRFEDWWGVPVQALAAIGGRVPGFWTCNAGMFVVRRDRVKELRSAWLEAAAFCAERGWKVTEELPLALALVWLTRPAGHCVWDWGAYWVSDWAGQWCGRLPQAGKWRAEEYMTGAWRIVDPAVVHALRSKQALAAYGGYHG